MSRTKTITFRVRVGLLDEFKQAVADVNRLMSSGDGEAFQSAMLEFSRNTLEGRLLVEHDGQNVCVVEANAIIK